MWGMLRLPRLAGVTAFHAQEEGSRWDPVPFLAGLAETALKKTNVSSKTFQNHSTFSKFKSCTIPWKSADDRSAPRPTLRP